MPDVIGAPKDLASEFEEAGIKPTARIGEPDEDDLLAGADPGVGLSGLDVPAAGSG